MIPTTQPFPYYPPFQPYPQQGYGYQPSQIVNKYNINANGPLVDHNIINTVYEDVLPTKFYENTYLTVGERKNLYEYIRSVFIKLEDGEEIGLKGGGTKDERTLLSYLKFLDLNPYNNKSNNPYQYSPCTDMMIYRSCYPIRVDALRRTTKCAKDSVGLNVRIYFMSNGELYHSRVNSYKDGEEDKNANKLSYDIWREMSFYNYIRDNVVKKLKSPNFACMYGYYICNNSGLKPPELGTKNKRMNEKIHGKPTIRDALNAVEKTIDDKRKLVQIERANNQNSRCNDPNDPNNLNKEYLNKDAYSGSILIALTESPTYSIYDWARRTHIDRGTVHETLNVGFHNFKVWGSIIFQLMAALHVLQTESIRIKDFDVKHNVYIKDVNAKGDSTSYWKYKINKVDYYVPNYGYLLLIDSDYRELENIPNVIGKTDSDNKIFKIEFVDEAVDKEETKQKERKQKIKDDIFDDFKKAMDPTSFENAKKDGVFIPEDAIELLSRIHNDAEKSKTKKISDYISEFMANYMHNRIGTNLTPDELEIFRQYNDSIETKLGISEGDIAVLDGTFVMVVKCEDDDKCHIIEKRNNIYIKTQKQKSAIKKYPAQGQLTQGYGISKDKLGESDILETYVS